jgi:hypothetical protein
MSSLCFRCGCSDLQWQFVADLWELSWRAAHRKLQLKQRLSSFQITSIVVNRHVAQSKGLVTYDRP